jgi:proline iminopeptidase
MTKIKNIKMGFASITLVTAGLTMTACQNKSSDSPVAVGIPRVTEVTKENFMSGKEFCRFYTEITSKEVGIRVKVPKDYSRPELGSTEIYAYTNKTFDASLPSLVYVDGGPGQNTHGWMKDVLPKEVNEIHFDQRGLACSAPDTFEDYKNASLYSSENNIRDMDEIRKAYQISKWSVYGISYGTIPATMYGARFSERTTSVVLEGVVGTTDLIHQDSYKVEKLNLFLAKLTQAQRNSFTTLITEQSEDTAVLIKILFELFYSDRGLSDFQSKTFYRLVDEDGTIRRDVFARVREALAKADKVQLPPQQPSTVDAQIYQVIYCRELSARSKDGSDIDYSASRGFYVQSSGAKTNADKCDKVGVKVSDEKTYKIENYQSSVPFYYFQGSHDGATLAAGALAHWKKVPQNGSYFLLSQKGGHNPNMSKIRDSEQPARAAAQTLLFSKAVLNKGITSWDLSLTNFMMDAEQKWLLFQNPQADGPRIENEFRGISLKTKAF